MKKIILLLLALFTLLNASAQIKKPVKWSAKTEKISDTEFNLIMNATIESGWHMYSQFTPDGGPLPLVLTFKDSKGNFDLIGKAKETPYKKEFNKDFGVDEYYFENKAILTQRVKLKNPKVTKIVVNVDFQACQNQCIEDKVDLIFEIPVVEKTQSEVTTKDVDTSKIISTTIDTSKTEVHQQQKETPLAQPKKEEKKGLWKIFYFSFF